MSEETPQTGDPNFAQAMANYFAILFGHAYAFEGEGDNLKRVVKDAQLAEVYQFMLRMREAIGMCQRQFRHYGDLHRAKRTSHMSMVESQELEQKIERNMGIAQALQPLLDAKPMPIEDWLPIATAPQDGTQIRVLGKKENGEAYIETTYWWNIQWAVSLMRGYLPPTHWKPREAAPDGY